MTSSIRDKALVTARKIGKRAARARGGHDFHSFSLPSLLRGHVQMMSALGGGGGPPKADDSTGKLRECDSDRGRG